MGRINNNVKGITTKAVVDLYKLFSSSEKNSMDDFDYLIWGEYDGLKFRAANARQEFLSDEESASKYELHSLRIYSRGISSEEAINFAQTKNLPSLLVLTEIKLNEDIYQMADEIKDGAIVTILEKRIEDQICNYLKEKPSNTKHLLFYSLGYCEFVILFRTDDYQCVANIMAYLRSQSFSPISGGKNILMVQSTHSISGIHMNMLTTPLNAKNDISISISFQKTDDIYQVKKRILEGLHVTNNKDVSIKTLTGKYDLILNLKEFPVNDLVNLFYDIGRQYPEQLFVPWSKQFIKSVGDTYTQWHLDIQDCYDKPILGQKYLDRGSRNPRKLNISNISNFDHEYSNSFKLQLSQLIRDYNKYAMDRGADYLVIYELKSIIEIFLKQMAEDISNIRNRLTDNIEEALLNHHLNSTLGINLILGLLRNRLQAFHFFSEIYSSDSIFVRSSAKIFVLYMTVLEEIEKSINKKYKKQKINFFVTIDNRDTVETNDLFPDSKSRIIPIVLSSGSFFEISYNLELLFHEIAHYIHSPNRAYRNEKFSEMISESISIWIIHMLFGDNDVTPYLLGIFSENDLKRVVESLKNELKHEFWDKGGYSDTSRSIRVFPGQLKKCILSKYSYKDQKLSKFQEIFENNINDFIASLPEIVIENSEETSFSMDKKEEIKAIADDLLQKIDMGEELESVTELWNHFYYDQSNVINPEQKDLLDKINISWTSIIKMVNERKKILVDSWTDFIEKNFSDTINSISSSASKKSSNIHLLKHIAHSRLNESHIENSRVLADKIVKLFNNQEFLQLIIKVIDTQTGIYKESTADYYMCRLLNLNWNQYVNMISDFKHKTANTYTEYGQEELEIRKQIISRTDFYNEEVEEINDENNDLMHGTSCSYIVDCLNDATKRSDFVTNIIQGGSLSLIQEYFKKIAHEIEPNNDFQPEIDLIEQLWDIGMRLFFSKQLL